MVCSRQGFKQVLRDQCGELEVGNGEAVGGSHRQTSNRVGCPARVVLKRGNAVQALRESWSVGADSTPMRRGKRSVIENFTGSVAVDPVVIRPQWWLVTKVGGSVLKETRKLQ
nr:hypothetical protein Iba_chr01cCG4110 [Ipomoea batatas]